MSWLRHPRHSIALSMILGITMAACGGRDYHRESRVTDPSIGDQPINSSTPDSSQVDNHEGSSASDIEALARSTQSIAQSGIKHDDKGQVLKKAHELELVRFTGRLIKVSFDRARRRRAILTFEIDNFLEGQLSNHQPPDRDKPQITVRTVEGPWTGVKHLTLQDDGSYAAEGDNPRPACTVTVELQDHIPQAPYRLKEIIFANEEFVLY